MILEVEVFGKFRSLFKSCKLNSDIVTLKARNVCFKYILKVLLNDG